MHNILNDKRHRRRDARDIVSLLKFGGIFSDDEIKSILRAALPLAARSAKNGSARDYRAAMSVLFTAAKLEQAELPSVQEHEHVHVIDDNRRQRLIGLARKLGCSRIEIDEHVIDIDDEKVVSGIAGGLGKLLDDGTMDVPDSLTHSQQEIDATVVRPDQEIDNHDATTAWKEPDG